MNMNKVVIKILQGIVNYNQCPIKMGAIGAAAALSPFVKYRVAQIKIPQQ